MVILLDIEVFLFVIDIELCGLVVVMLRVLIFWLVVIVGFVKSGFWF